MIFIEHLTDAKSMDFEDDTRALLALIDQLNADLGAGPDAALLANQTSRFQAY